MTGYESPAKKKLWDALAKMGPRASPELRRHVEEAIAKIDDTDPATIREKLPAPVMRFFVECAHRGRILSQWAGRAHDAGFHIENMIVCHGLIQYALRGLYVLAWQRSRPEPLSEEDLRPFWDSKDHKATVDKLLPVLEASHLLNEPQGPYLREMNNARNKAAHGLVFGEIPLEEVAPRSSRIRHAALGALERMHGWFENPQPLLRTLEEEAAASRRGRPTRST